MLHIHDKNMFIIVFNIYSLNCDQKKISFPIKKYIYLFFKRYYLESHPTRVEISFLRFFNISACLCFVILRFVVCAFPQTGLSSLKKLPCSSALLIASLPPNPFSNLSHCPFLFKSQILNLFHCRANGFLPMALFDFHFSCVPVSTNFLRALS